MKFSKKLFGVTASLFALGVSVSASVLLDAKSETVLKSNSDLVDLQFGRPSLRNPETEQMQSDGGFLEPRLGSDLHGFLNIMNEESAKTRVDEVSQAISEERYEEALVLIRQLKGFTFSQDNRAFWEARVLIALDRPTEAEAILASRNIEGKPQASQFVLLMGLARMEAEKWDDAEEILLPLVSRSLPLNSLLVEVVIKAKSAPNSIDLGGLLWHPLSYDVDPHILYNAAVVLFDMHEYERAMEKAKRGVKIDPQHAGNQYMLGTSLLVLKRYDEARDALKKTLHIEPDNAEALGNLGLINYEQGKIALALSLMISALDSDISYANGWSNYLFMLSNELVPREGLQPLPAPPENSEGSVAEWHWRAGLKAGEASDLHLSVRHFLRSLSLNLNDPNVQNDFAHLLYRADRKALAIPFLRAAVALAPDSTLVRNNLQELLKDVELDSLNQQIDTLLQKIEVDDTAVHRTNLAKAYKALDRNEESLEQYRIAFELEPDVVGYRINFAQFLAGLGNYQEAIEVFQPVLKKLPNSPQLRARMTWLLLQQESPNWRDLELAVQLARESCEMTDYQMPGFLGLLVQALVANGEQDKAAEIQKKIDALTAQEIEVHETVIPSP